MKTVLITGATSGFGEACALVFAKAGHRIIATGRRAERLASLKTKLEKEHNAQVYNLSFDVQNRKAVFEAVESLPQEWKSIDILINNAGLALGRDSFEDADIEDWDTMINTNVKGLLYVTRAVIPYLSPSGAHIINIGSIAGKEVYEKGNTYCATKHAVDALSQAMRIDLLPKGIKVTAIHPGAAETEFSLVRFKGAEATANAVYEGFQPLTAMDVAETVFFTTTLPPHVCINDLVIMPTQQASAVRFHKNA